MKNINYYENADSTQQQAYINLQSNCVLCSTTLELKFEAIGEVEIKEEAHCPSCEVRTRAKTHSLQ